MEGPAAPGRDLSVGIQLPEVEREVRWPEVASLARQVEALGFDSIWLGDHHLYRSDGRPERGPWEAWTQLAALAAITDSVRLGPLVAATAFHPPGFIARMSASIDEISGERFTLALGAGWNRGEFEAFGLPFDHTVSRFEEAFEIIRRLLAGEHVTFSGSFHEAFDAVVLPAPGRRIPLMVGSDGPRMLAITLPHVDWWNAWYSWYGNTPAGFAAKTGEIDQACLRAGREPRSVRRSACVLVSAAVPGGERTHDAPPVELPALRDHLDGLRAAGADEAILVLDPINEPAVAAVAQALELQAR